jgi:hypothetical protein
MSLAAWNTVSAESTATVPTKWASQSVWSGCILHVLSAASRTRRRFTSAHAISPAHWTRFTPLTDSPAGQVIASISPVVSRSGSMLIRRGMDATVASRLATSPTISREMFGLRQGLSAARERGRQASQSRRRRCRSCPAPARRRALQVIAGGRRPPRPRQTRCRPALRPRRPPAPAAIARPSDPARRQHGYRHRVVQGSTTPHRRAATVSSPPA